MRPSVPLVLTLAAALFATACRDDPSPTAPPPAPALAPLLSAGAPAASNRFMVVFRDDVPVPPGLADRLVATHGGSIEHRFGSAVRGFSGVLPAGAVQAMRAHPLVAWVEQDQVISVVGSQSPAPWGLDRIDDRAGLDNSYTWTTTGAGVTAYVIDTGLYTSHGDFGTRASIGFDALGGNGQDCHGHGTHVAGTLGGTQWGVAKDVSLVGVRVLNCSGSGFTSWVVAGVDWVTANHVKPAVANMSLGGVASSTLDQAVQNSVASGVSYAVAAGNSNADACGTSPARVRQAMTVGATDQSDARASFSNWGGCLSWFAPGVGITSAWIGSPTATNTISGTSMASPHTAGVAALYLEANPTAAPSNVHEALWAAATRDAVANAKSVHDHLLYSLVAGAPPPNQPPTSQFTASCSGLQCSFTDQSSDPDGSVVAWSWSFGDGQGSSAQSPTHTYAADGSYTVTLTVTDDDGAPGSSSQVVNVSAPPPGGITLSASTSRWNAWYVVTLSWSGATGSQVEVHLDGSMLQTTANDGTFIWDTLQQGSYTWQICEPGGGVCSNPVTTTF